MEENSLFSLLCELEAVQKLLARDNSTLIITNSKERATKIQEEMDILSIKETELYNKLREELFRERKPFDADEVLESINIEVKENNEKEENNDTGQQQA